MVRRARQRTPAQWIGRRVLSAGDARNASPSPGPAKNLLQRKFLRATRRIPAVVDQSIDNPSFSPVVEVNGDSTLSEGDNMPLPFNGVDIANLRGGEDVVIAVFGAEHRSADGFGVRVGYESPLTDNEDLSG